MARHGLGKGLAALLPPEEAESRSFVPAEGGTAAPRNSAPKKAPPGTSGETFLPLDKLRPNPAQPRKYFDEEALGELADSIREHGIIQPVIAEDAGDGTYIIVAGERRTRAARLAGLAEVPVILRDYSEEKRMEVALIENVQRAGLNPIEEAAAYRQLMELAGLSQDEAAAKVGKNRSTVANALRLLKLSPEIQKALEEGALSPGHARAILSVTGKAAQEALFKSITGGGLSVREAEKRAAAMNEKKSPKPGPAPAAAAGKRAPEIGAMEEKFIGTLGTRVIIEGDLNRGQIHIDYYSMEDLERLYEILGG